VVKRKIPSPHRESKLRIPIVQPVVHSIPTEPSGLLKIIKVIDIKYMPSFSSSFLGSTAQLRPWPPPQNPSHFRGYYPLKLSYKYPPVKKLIIL
jgi:hypothetical protein